MRTVYKNGTVYTGNGFVTDFSVEKGIISNVGRAEKTALWARRIKPRQMKQSI